MAATSLHYDVLLDSEERHEADFADADVDTLVGSIEGTRSGEVAAKVSSGFGRYRWQEWRSPTNRVENVDGDGQI